MSAALLSLTACDFEDIGGAHYTRDFHYSYPMAANGKLSVETFNGAVEVSGWDQDTVDISGTKQGPTQEAADELEVSVDHTANAVSVRVVRPSDRRRNDQGARFVIKVPRRAVLDRLVSSNGAIRTSDGAGPARFHTSNGAIQVAALRAVWRRKHQRPHRRRSHQGRWPSAPRNIERERRSQSPGQASTRKSARIPATARSPYARPATLNARVAARTSNGKITSDLDMRTSGEISRTRLEGVIGAGGPLIDLTTSNGGIRITRE